MKIGQSVRLAAIVLLAAQSVGGQEPAADMPVTPNTRLFARIERAVIAVHSIFGRPLHPIISGVAPGGSWGAGLGFDAPGRGPWDGSAKAIYTLNKYWVAEASAGYYGRRAFFEGFGRGRDMTRLDFYGPGPNSVTATRSDFRLRDPVVGAQGKFRLLPWLALGGRVEEMWPSVGSGQHDGVLGTEVRFTEAQAPGLSQQPRFGRYQGSVDLHLPAGAGDAFYQGTKSRVTYAIFDDQELELFNFRRLDIEAQQVLASPIPHHRLTLSGWMSTTMTDDGQDVPFYLQRTLGGKSEVRSVHEDRIGSDGTDATLRGHRNLRFRDRHLMLLQAEYRLPLWGPIDATLFTDAGKVASTRDDLDFSDLRRDFGFSLSIMKGWATAARMDVGFGSGQGTRIYFTIGELTP
ncbi:MAG TPA: BamA/TamA family outer membrane protein [Gemmatimonadaceae bacterium]|nr:BamA/TamA family outer membrane protein [Gemmatimonadaceae bacterium]